MNSFIKNILLLILFGCSFVSCEKEIEFHSDYTTPKIVVKSIIRPGQGLYVRVDKSRSILDDKRFFEALPNAKVSLFENGEFVSELVYSSRIDTSMNYLYEGKYEKIPFENGNYFDTTVIIKAGATYRLEVSNEGLNTASCETTVPLPVELSNIECSMVKMPHEYYENYFRVNTKVDISDPANEKNFYALNVYPSRGVELATLKPNQAEINGSYNGGSYYGSYSPSSNLNVDSIQPTDTIVESYEFSRHFYSSDPVLISTDLIDVFDSESEVKNRFNDELISGEDYTLSFWLETQREVYTELGEYYIVYVIIEHLSEELFKFYNSVEHHREAVDNPFAEPVPVFSNVVDGLGVFGSEATSFTHVTVGDFPIDGKTYIDYNTYRVIYEGGSGYNY